MYDETMKDPCRYGLAEHVGEQICVRCGAVLADDAVTTAASSDSKPSDTSENAKRPDQVDALDAILNDVLPDSWGDQKITRKDAKAKLSALLVEARIDELERLHRVARRGGFYGAEIHDRIKELQQGALAHAESLTASGKQADKSVVRELLKLRKLYDKYETDGTTGFDLEPIATWTGYKWFRNPISDRIEEITGVRSDQEVAQWLEQGNDLVAYRSKQPPNIANPPSEELEKQREA